MHSMGFYALQNGAILTFFLNTGKCEIKKANFLI